MKKFVEGQLVTLLLAQNTPLRSGLRPAAPPPQLTIHPYIMHRLIRLTVFLRF
jgi:hypothetical protein